MNVLHGTGEVARELGIPIWQLMQWIDRGRLPDASLLRHRLTEIRRSAQEASD